MLSPPTFTVTSGSSPRMRGKRSRRRCPTSSPRIIPAHAGQTGRLRSIGQLSADHPRACGANGVWGTFNIRGHGSSPRMRGKPTDKFLIDIPVRIIPAHAGQTTSGTSHSLTHPGSSPRMRGKHLVDNGDVNQERIIPAHAGQTNTLRQGRRRAPDHPRACGANSPTSPSTGRHNGSSPRMRGKQVPHDMPCRALRIIPAHAGQTRRVERAAFLITDHPRACGANVAVLLPPL